MDKPTPKYVLVEQKIKHAIKHREIVDKLPGERTLAKEYGFSYMTIRKAVENLVAEGLLYKIPMKGTFVADRKTRKKKTKIMDYIEYPIFSYDVGVVKPNLKGFRHVLKTSKCKPEKTIMIGDKMDECIAAIRTNYFIYVASNLTLPILFCTKSKCPPLTACILRIPYVP